jgi:hypothetical protein
MSSIVKRVPVSVFPTCLQSYDAMHCIDRIYTYASIEFALHYFVKHKENGPGWNSTSNLNLSRQRRKPIVASSICLESNIHTQDKCSEV